MNETLSRLFSKARKTGGAIAYGAGQQAAMLRRIDTLNDEIARCRNGAAARQCRTCGADARPGDRYCRQCGQKL